MSNREARRQQSRTTRSQRPASRPGGGRPSRPTGPSRAPRRQNGLVELLSQPYVLLVIALVVILGGVLVFLALRDGGGDDDLVAALEAAEANLPADLANGAKLGRDDAPIKLTAYEDFQCPFCLRYTANQEPAIIEEYVKTGKVQLIFNHLPILGTESTQAALASQCAADQNKFWQYQNKLFTVQAEAGQSTNEEIDEGRFSSDNLKKYAAELGLNTDEFNQCYDSDKHLQLVQDQQRQARAFGITGTPSFLINGRPAGSAPADLDGWRTLLNGVLEQLTPTASPSASASPSGTASPAATATTPAATATTPAATATPTP